MKACCFDAIAGCLYNNGSLNILLLCLFPVLLFISHIFLLLSSKTLRLILWDCL